MGLLLASPSASVTTIAFGSVYSRLRECVSRDEDIDVGRKQVIQDDIVGLDEGGFLSPWSV